MPNSTPTSPTAGAGAQKRKAKQTLETGIHQHSALDVSTQGAAEYYQRVYTRSICSIWARLLVDTT